MDNTVLRALVQNSFLFMLYIAYIVVCNTRTHTRTHARTHAHAHTYATCGSWGSIKISKSKTGQPKLKYKKHLRKKFKRKGVKMIAPDTVFFSNDTKIGKNVVIEPFVTIDKNVNGRL